MAPHPLPALEGDVFPSEAESPDGIDLTLIHWMLSLTPLERLEVLLDWVDGISELRNGRIGSNRFLGLLRALTRHEVDSSSAELPPSPKERPS